MCRRCFCWRSPWSFTCAASQQELGLARFCWRAALLGLGMNLRETIGFYRPWLVLASIRLRLETARVVKLCYVALSAVLSSFFAFGWFGYWFLTDPHYRTIWFGWRESMCEESARHPVSSQQPSVRISLTSSSPRHSFCSHFRSLSVSEWRKRRLSPLLALGVDGPVRRSAAVLSTTAPPLTGATS